MSNEEIYKKIEEVYNSEKGKNFIVHLVRSFLPTDRSTLMLENTNKKVMRCCITGTPLISKAELVSFQIENHKEIFESMTKRFFGEKTENIVADKFKGKMIAVECEKSERLLCLPAVEQLLNFVSSESLKGNKHIGNMLSNMRKSAEGESKLSGNSWEDTKTTSDAPKKKAVDKPVMLKSVNKLADNDVLQNLKKQLEDAGK